MTKSGEQVRTTRNLNDSLDLLKKINIDHEKALVQKENQVISTKTNSAVRLVNKDKAAGRVHNVPLSHHCIEDGPDKEAYWEDESADEEEESESETEITKADEGNEIESNSKCKNGGEQTWNGILFQI